MNGVPDCHAEGIVEDRLLLLKSRRRSEVSCCHSVGRRLDSWFLLRSRTVREPRELHALGRVPEKLLPVKTRLLRPDTRLRLEGKEPCIPLKPRSTEVTVGPVQPTPVQTEPQGSVVLVQPEKPDGQVAGETAVLRDIKPNV
jgi:hypothetical protein